jgi:hypothetical protein
MIELLEKLEPLLKSKSTNALKHIDDLHSIPGAQELINMIEGYKFKAAFTALEKLRKELTDNE